MKTRKKIDIEQIEEMAAEFATQEEIARDMGFERTLFRTREDVRAAFERGKNGAKLSLRHLMFNAARSGDRTMLIFLAKNELGYRDNPEPAKEIETDPQTNTLLDVLRESAQTLMNATAICDVPENADQETVVDDSED